MLRSFPDLAVQSSCDLDGEVERWQADRLASVSGSTANKELMRLKHVLNRAVAWSYIKTSTARLVMKGKEAPGRVRYLFPPSAPLLLDRRDR